MYLSDHPSFVVDYLIITDIHLQYNIITNVVYSNHIAYNAHYMF